jgi:hypothetical protein
LIESDKIHGLRICRKFEYFVDPLSEKIVELGTRSYPYKSINLVLYELFNFMTEVDSTIAIKVSRIADHEMSHGHSLIYNMTDIVFEPYNPSLRSSSANKTEYGNYL